MDRPYRPDGSPRFVRLFDIGPGKEFDRYTAVFPHVRYPGYPGYAHMCPALSMSANPFHPQGFGQHVDVTWPQGTRRPAWAGKRIRLEDAPEAVRQCIMQDYVAYYGPVPPVQLPLL